jgi:ferredoxin
VESNGRPFHILENRTEAPARAFIGVRACDLAALDRLDRVLTGDRYPDPLYQRNRERIFLVAVSCSEPSSSCFCTSMGAGPEVESGFDILLTEIAGEGDSRFVARAGSDSGREVLHELGAEPASGDLRREAANTIAAGRGKITRQVNARNIGQKLFEHFEHPEWERVASRCFGCGNCTQVCPTCFCVTVEDSSDIDGRRAERWRKWDSCFTLSYSYIHGGSVRQSAKARYRQWLTHKFAAWQDQFGTPGCTGCGRCITWCPAGIDVTQVISAIAGSARDTEAAR